MHHVSVATLVEYSVFGVGLELLQLIAKQKGLSHPVIDTNVALVDELLDKNRKKPAD